jgi:hypothetical protein
MDRKNFFNDLEFQDQHIVDQKIQPKGVFEDVPFVLDRHEQFTPYGNRPQITFPQETSAVDALD